MADIFPSEKRSEIMSRVKSRGNKGTEMVLLRLMRGGRITGWRRRSKIFGKPDFVFPKSKVAIFVDGCFWHGCPKHVSLPSSNTAFWEKKLSSNKVRDRLVNRTLKTKGWTILRIWEHDLSAKKSAHVVKRICDSLLAASIKKGEV